MADFEIYRKKRNAYLNIALEKGRLKDTYQDEETRADPKHGRKIVKKIREENGIGDRIPAEAPDYEDIFEDLLADDPGGAILYEDHLDYLAEMVEIAERETAERRASSDLLMQLIFDTYYKPEVDLELRRNVTGAFLEYNYQVELTCRKLSYIRTACMYEGISLVKDIPVDRIIAEKIKDIMSTTVEVYDDKLPLSQIPGFTVIRNGTDPYMDLDTDGEKEEFGDLDSIMEGIDEISEYILRHPQQVDVQCLMSVVTGTEGLSEIAKRSFALDEAIDRYSVTEEGRNLDGRTWRKLFNGWIMVKAFARVTKLILKFVSDYSDRTVGAATDALESLLPSISYALVQRNVRIALRQMLLEGRIYEFTLSDVTIPTAAQKAAKQMKCISFEDAPKEVTEELLSMIRKDSRIIPLAQDYDQDSILKDLSFICLKDNSPCGAVFVSEEEDSLILELAYTTDNMAMACLVVNAYGAVLDMYGPVKNVRIPVLSDRSAILIEKLVPGARKDRAIVAQKK